MTTNTRPVPNTQSALASTADNKIRVFLITPWTQFFQQFVQKAAAAVPVIPDGSPFFYTPNQNGNVHVNGGTVSNLSIIRGLDTLDVTGQKLLPLGIGDTLRITYTIAPTIKFLGS
jgi:hypothetical protein